MGASFQGVNYESRFLATFILAWRTILLVVDLFSFFLNALCVTSDSLDGHRINTYLLFVQQEDSVILQNPESDPSGPSPLLISIRDGPWQNRAVKNCRQTWDGMPSSLVPFFQFFGSQSIWTAARSCKTRLKNGIWRWKRYWHILIGKNGSFKPVRIFKIHVIYYQNQFFPCFDTVFLPVYDLSTSVWRLELTHSKVCRTLVKVLSRLFKVVFALFPIKPC